MTRLPRLCLLLEEILKLTEPGHPDKELLPLLITLLGDFVKSTQPGIAAAEGKVKFWNLCESLVYVRSEIMVCCIHVMQALGVTILPGYGSVQREPITCLLGHIGTAYKIGDGPYLGGSACSRLG